MRRAKLHGGFCTLPGGSSNLLKAIRSGLISASYAFALVAALNVPQTSAEPIVKLVDEPAMSTANQGLFAALPAVENPAEKSVESKNPAMPIAEKNIANSRSKPLPSSPLQNRWLVTTVPRVAEGIEASLPIKTPEGNRDFAKQSSKPTSNIFAEQSVETIPKSGLPRSLAFSVNEPQKPAVAESAPNTSGVMLKAESIMSSSEPASLLPSLSDIGPPIAVPGTISPLPTLNANPTESTVGSTSDARIGELNSNQLPTSSGPAWKTSEQSRANNLQTTVFPSDPPSYSIPRQSTYGAAENTIAVPPTLRVDASILPTPYWIESGRLSIRAPLDRTAVVDLDSLIWAAIAHSPYIQSIRIQPQILQTEIDQAQGAFDPSRFASSIWNDRSDPVGNTLTTGGASRFNEHFLDNKAGVRKKNELGGNWEAAQEVGLRDNNSNFFIPHQQADTRMILRYTQPLLKGAGRFYNRSSISIAQLGFEVSNHESHRALQTHIMDVIESYWELLYQRSVVLQLHRGVTRLQAIETKLAERADLDAMRNQLLRASSSIGSLKARYARAMAQVVTLEERLRRLVNAPWIQPALVDEIIPASAPDSNLSPIQIEVELDQALMSRHDILAIRDEIKSAGVKLRVAEQDLRPTLNVVTDFYVRGLNGNYDVANSFADQFTAGSPSYSGGLEWVRPKNQTVANAIRRARDLEMRQLLFQLEDKLLEVGAEVRSSAASAQANHADLTSSIDATISAQAEVEYLDARWRSGAFLEPLQISQSLEQLMDAEQRLVQAEGSWAAAQAQYMISLAKLRYAVGNLMTFEPVAETTSQ
jgi:outer membrane protein TolC